MILKLNILLKRVLQDLLGFHTHTNLGEFLSFMKRRRSHKKTLQNDAAADDEEEEETRSGELIEIPKELLEIIFSVVNVSDRFRLKSVCKSWKNILEDDSFITTLPWMLLPPPQRDDDDSTLSFFDMVEGKIHKFRNFPKELKGSSYCGSSKGWMLLGKGTIQKPYLYLLNPLSMSFFELPSVLTIPEAMLETPFGSIEEPFDVFAAFAKKLQLSSSDAFSSTVALILGYGVEVLAVCKAGVDDSWIVIDHKPENSEVRVMDIMFSQDGRVLNVLKNSYHSHEQEEDGSVIVRQHMVGCESITVKEIPNLSTIEMYKPFIEEVIGEFRYVRNWFFCQHLVESVHGEVLIVTVVNNCFRRFFDWDKHRDELTYEQVGVFKVHLVHEDNSVVGMTTTEIESLGDQVLFVAEAGSFSYKAPATVEGIQNNQIFFIANGLVNPDVDYDLNVFREHGVYSLDQRKIRRCFPSIGNLHHYNPCWFTPTL